MLDPKMKKDIENVIAQVTENDNFQGDDNFIDDLGIDSMMLLEIVVRVGKIINIKIPEQYISELQTYNDVIRVVSELYATNKEL
ncbi:acyl carrier protein [Paenibacillus sp. ISL-20]|uniref:acyl carrier protein n=1 Tax=Paenibacillus sp. ISL-20 TaxID=2819163 RepID=UPI001BE93D25|nr:acyl carrier protein [Paenibacillus sp. ISL-20]MBT2762681.1 acyl carrier protein [Paenibacillus sp. ISL-20]